MTLLGGALHHIFGLFYRNDMPSSPETTKSQNTSETVDVFERFKSYLDQKVESLTSGLVSQASSGTQKLERAAEAGKLKFQGNKDQFLFNSELQGTLDETANFLAARDVEKAGEKVEELRKNLRHRQKITSLLTRAKPVGWRSKNTKLKSSRATQRTRRGSRKRKKERSRRRNKMASKELRKARTLLVLLALALVMIGCFFEVCSLPFL